jgi:hypothetical protein
MKSVLAQPHARVFCKDHHTRTSLMGSTLSSPSVARMFFREDAVYSSVHAASKYYIPHHNHPQAQSITCLSLHGDST